MKRLLDINMWIALTLETHPQHLSARTWYNETPLTAGDLVFCLPTEMGFVRLITQAAVMHQAGAAPLSNAQAAAFLTNLYNDAAVSRVEEPTTTRNLWLQLADRHQPGPNIWMDAYLAAFAMTLGAELVTFDRGFAIYQQTGLILQLLECP